MFVWETYCCAASLSVSLDLLSEQSASIWVQHMPLHKQLVWWTETRGSTHCSTVCSFFCKQKEQGNIRHYKSTYSFIINERDIFRQLHGMSWKLRGIPKRKPLSKYGPLLIPPYKTPARIFVLQIYYRYSSAQWINSHQWICIHSWKKNHKHVFTE